MALQKSIEQNTGVLVSYWRVDRVDIQYFYDADTYIKIHLEGYADAQTRAAGHSPVVQQVHRADNPAVWTTLVGADGKNSNSDNPTKLAYDWLKANCPDFSGAVDC